MTNFPANFSGEMLEAIDSFPCIPQAVVEIIRSIDDDSVRTEQLARKIESDLGMLTGVLKLVNSPRFSVSGEVVSVQQAVMILGFNAIRRLACLGGIAKHFQDNCNNAFNYEHFMQHSIGVACCAKFIAKRVGINSDVAFVSGLLHDVGQWVVAVTLPEQLRRILEYKRTLDCHRSVAERAILGLDHAEIGEHLIRRWNFPPVISEAIGNHHRVFESVSTPVADMVHVAEILSHALDFGSAGQVPPLSHAAMLRLGLSFQQIRPNFDEIEEEYFDFAHSLGLNKNSR